MIPIDMMFIIKWYVNRHHAPCTSHLRRSWSPSERRGQRGQQSGGAVRNDPLVDWQLSGMTGMTLNPSGPWNRWPFWVNHPSFSSHQLMIELGCIASVIWVVKPNFQPETVVIFVPAYSLHVWCFFEKLQFTLEVCWHPLTSGMFTPKTPAFCCTKGNSAEQSWKDLITT